MTKTRPSLLIPCLLALVAGSAFAKKPIQLDCIDKKYENDPSFYMFNFRFLLNEEKKEIRRLAIDGKPSPALKVGRWDDSNISIEWEHLSPVQFHKPVPDRSLQENISVSSKMSFSVDRVSGGFVASTTPVVSDRILAEEEARQLFTNEQPMSFFDFLVLHRQSFSGKCTVAKPQF